jgi:O-methyltransferase/methyltransferase family protein
MTQRYFEWLNQASSGVQLQFLMSGHWIAQAIGVAADLGIADLLSKGPKTSGELAIATGSDHQSLYRLMRALASVGVFNEVEPERFALTPIAEGLRADAPASQRDRALQMCSDVQWRTWGQLGYSVRTGQPAFKQVHGMDAWEYRARNPDVDARFNAAMTSLATQVANAIASAYDFSGLGILVDVGGGHGALLVAILRANPRLRAVLFDLPQVAEGAREPLRAAGLLERCDIVGGNMFEEVPAGGDAYVLSRVIHDWNDAHSVTVLANCRRVMTSCNKLLLAEEVLPPGDQPSYGKLTDLNMLVSPGGRERTEAEYRTLYAAAGFELTRVIPTRSRISLIEGEPV